MGRKTGAKKSAGGGFLSRLFLCRPRHPEDTGVLIQRNSSKAANLEKKKSKEFPFLPSPPSDEATPITSNRKSFDNGCSSIRTKNSSIPASTRLHEVTTANSPSADFMGELEASVKEKKSSVNGASGENKKDGRKSYPSFHNTHPAQENVKAKLEWFQHAFSSPQNQRPDTTESTDDLTENYADEDFLIIRQVPSGDEAVVDCGDDPFERAYALWYRKGMLKWRPKSVAAEVDAGSVNAAAKTGNEVEVNQVAESSEIARGEAADTIADEITTGDSIDLIIVEREEGTLPVEKSTPFVPLEGALNKMNEDDAALLMKYRNKVDRTCAACKKDTSFVIELVRCLQCKEELYCSIFCRGNDRYNHAVSCSALNQSNDVHERTRSGQKIVKEQEEKKEESRDSVSHKVGIAHSEKDPSKMPDPGSQLTQKVAEMFVDPSKHSKASGPVSNLEVNAATATSTPSKTVELYTDIVKTSSSRTNSLRKSRQVPIVSLFGADEDQGQQTPIRLHTG
jgi:MYND finger